MIDVVIVVAYLICLLSLGLYNSKVKDYKQYSAGGKEYSALVIFCTLTASYIGGGFTIGLSAKTFSYGILYILAMFGFSIKEILIAKYLAPKMAPFQDTCSTTGDIMALSYGKAGKILTGIASVIVCGGIIGAQFAACGNIFYIFFDLPITQGVILTAVIIITYVAFGGLKSVIRASIFNFIILLSVIAMIAYLGMEKIGSIDNFIALTPKANLTPDGGLGYITFIILFLSFFFGETLVPPYTQRLLIGTSTRETQKGTLYSGLSSFFIFAMVGIIGMVAYILNPLLEPDLAFPYIVSELLPTGLKGIGVAAMLAIIISSADAFLNAVSIALKKDLLEPIFGIKNTSLDYQVALSRVITLITGIIATIFALSTSSVLDILLYSYQFWTPFILVPLIAAIYGIRTSKKIFWISSVAGIATVIMWNIFSPYISSVKGSLEGVLLGILVNCIIFTSLRFTSLNSMSPGK